MLKMIDVMNDVTQISDREDINIENFLEASNYSTRLNTFLSLIGQLEQSNTYKFLPSFKGKKVCNSYGLDHEPKENVMKKFIIVSPLFLEDENIRELENTIGQYTEYMRFDKTTVIIE